MVDPDGHGLTLIYDRAAASARSLWEKIGKDRQPPQGRVIPMLSSSREVITAVDSHPGRNGSVLLYLFYPQLGALFMAQHYLDVQGENVRQVTLFAKCEFKWSAEQ